MMLDQFAKDVEAAIDLAGVAVAPETVFKSLAGWDSLCVLNVIAMVDEIYGVTVTGRQIEAASTVADLYEAVLTLKD